MITYPCLLNTVFSVTGISDNNFYISDNNFYIADTDLAGQPMDTGMCIFELSYHINITAYLHNNLL